MNYTKDFLNVVLQDDETEFGGISFIGETLQDFLDEVGLNENTPIVTVNKSLIVCGIKPITNDCEIEKKQLLYWDCSAICGDTAFFYFKENGKLLCVEYWLDEEKVAPLAQYYELSGEITEDERYLTDAEIILYTDFCKNVILENNKD